MRWLGLALLVVGLGCASGTPGEVVPQDAPAILKVDNLRPEEMTIYVLQAGGVRERIGRATGSSVTTLTIPVSYSRRNAVVRFIADPVGLNSIPISQDVNVGPGDEILMRITP